AVASTAQVVRPEQRPGSIAGVVQITADRPAIGATVTIVGTVLQTLVLPDGTFRIDGVPPGVYDISASGQLYRSTTIEEVSVRASQTTTLTITLKPYPLISDVRVKTPWRRAQPIYESSSSVSVVKTTDAPFIAGHSIERILASTAGVGLNGGLASIRGSSGGSITVGSRVGLFIDGMPLTSPDMGIPVNAAIPLAAIEQVEIAKGSATTLYGPGVISGMVNIITPDPAERERANVNIYTGFYTDPGSSDVRWWGSRPQRFSGAELMWTQRSKSVGALVAATLISDDGYRQHESGNRYNVFGRVNVFMSRGAELRVAGILARHEHGPLLWWRNEDSALFASRVDSTNAPVTTSLRTLSAEYRGVDSKSFSFVVRGTLQAVANDDPRPDSSSQRTESSRYIGEIHLTSYLNRRIAFSYGGLAQFELGESPMYGDGLTRTVGGYCQMEFTNLQDIVASIGTRVDLVLMPGAEDANVLELSPTVGVAYHPVPSTSFRASITRGYRAPSVAERLFNTSRYGVPIISNAMLGPEQSWQGEVGSA
ncbi:MAG: TonB-dependent receptor, partial [bacterium]|nr:TonB-dependent receptor [Candidatus Kapabacteria bacterium]